MLQLLQPIWLWASAVVIFPVIIHLWNIKQGKTLKVGSIFLFAESAKSGAKKRKLTELLLLLLRCLLLISLSMLMAKPAWQQHNDTKEKGWIFIPKNELHDAYQAYQPLIDSLINKGFVLHNFDEHSKQENLKEALFEKQDSSDQSSLSYWTLLKEADDEMLSSLPVYLFTDNKLKHFTGARPELSNSVRWYTFTGSDTASSWLQKAYKISADSIRFIIGNSHSFGTQYSYQALSLHDPSQAYMTITSHLYSGNQNDDSMHQATGVDTSSLTVVIYSKAFADDARYVEAAVKALREFTQYNIKINRCDAVTDIPNNSDWLFWLSDDAIPNSLLIKNVLVYEQGTPLKKTSSLLTDDYSSLTTTNNILVYQRVQSSNDSSYQTLWQDGFGNPVLSLENDKNAVYHFYSHFNPQWNDLVWNACFPQAMYELLFAKQSSDETKDKRIIDNSQIQPAFAANKEVISSKEAIATDDISKEFWLIAFALLLAERILSFRIKNSRA